jgi:porin
VGAALLVCAAFVMFPAAALAAPESSSQFWLDVPPRTYNTPWGLLRLQLDQGGTVPRWEQADSLTGNWGGYREEIYGDFGVTLLGSYMAEVAGNPVGGMQHNVRYAHNIDLTLLAALGKTFRWAALDDTYFIVVGSQRTGQSNSKLDIGNFYAVQQVYGPSETIRLINLALGQRLFDGRLDITAGRLVANDDFLASTLYCNSQNLAVCPAPFLVPGDVSFSIYPTAVWGARARITPDPAYYLLAGIYNADKDAGEKHFHGADFGISSNSGVLAVGEVGVLPDRLSDSLRPTGLPGHYKAGGYYDAEPLVNFRSAETQRGTWGIYLACDQMLYQETLTSPGEGLSAFFAVAYAPPDVNFQQYFVDWGLAYQGLIPGRDTDIAGFFGAYGRFSSDNRAAQRAAGKPEQTDEWILEVNYRWNVLPWFYIQPDVQGVLNPGGANNIDNALVLAMQFGLPF